MLRKLIVLAITSGLAKKAWDRYKKDKHATAAAAQPARKRKPASRSRSTESKPEAG
jgi:hypothetical protein